MAYEALTRSIEKLAQLDARLDVLGKLDSIVNSSPDAEVTLRLDGVPFEARLSRNVARTAIAAQIERLTTQRATVKAGLDAALAALPSGL